jgi:plasmid maintenance system antidote protein VapI
MKHRNLKVLIIQAGFDFNADFAEAVGMHESLVSRVLNGRRKLTTEQAVTWIETLKCEPEELRGVTRSD